MASRGDLVTISLMGLAAASVVVTLGIFRNVWLTFGVYHLGFCLLVPAILRRRPVRASFNRRAVTFGLGSGAIAFAGILLLDRLVGNSLLDPATLRVALDTWAGGHVLLLTTFMILCNGMAEEVFWRGFIQDRLQGWGSRPRAIVTVAAFYASYHGFTALRLTGRPAVAALLLAIVFGAGVFWGWTRERFGTCVPAMISHAIATAGYMFVGLRLIGVL